MPRALAPDPRPLDTDPLHWPHLLGRPHHRVGGRCRAARPREARLLQERYEFGSAWGVTQKCLPGGISRRGGPSPEGVTGTSGVRRQRIWPSGETAPARPHASRSAARWPGWIRRPRAAGPPGQRTASSWLSLASPDAACTRWLLIMLPRSGLAGVQPTHGDQAEPEVADLGQQPVQRRLVSEQAEDDRLVALAADLEAVEPGGPPAVQDTRHADLIPGRPAAGAHPSPRRRLAGAAERAARGGADCTRRRHPQLLCRAGAGLSAAIAVPPACCVSFICVDSRSGRSGWASPEGGT